MYCVYLLHLYANEFQYFANTQSNWWADRPLHDSEAKHKECPARGHVVGARLYRWVYNNAPVGRLPACLRGGGVFWCVRNGFGWTTHMLLIITFIICCRRRRQDKWSSLLSAQQRTGASVLFGDDWLTSVRCRRQLKIQRDNHCRRLLCSDHRLLFSYFDWTVQNTLGTAVECDVNVVVD